MQLLKSLTGKLVLGASLAVVSAAAIFVGLTGRSDALAQSVKKPSIVQTGMAKEAKPVALKMTMQTVKAAKQAEQAKLRSHAATLKTSIASLKAKSADLAKAKAANDAPTAKAIEAEIATLRSQVKKSRKELTLSRQNLVKINADLETVRKRRAERAASAN